MRNACDAGIKDLVKIPALWVGLFAPCVILLLIYHVRLAKPQYQIRKDKKVGLLVSPKDVTVLGSTSDLTEEEVRLEAPVHA